MKFQIREAREKAGYSQKELAEIVGVAPNTFHGYESGKHDPKSILLERIAKACHVSVDYLLGIQPDECETPKPPVHTPDMSDDAMKLAKDYDGLDSYGKRVLRVVADEEMQRVADAQAKLAAEKQQKKRFTRKYKERNAIPEEEEKIVYLPLSWSRASAGEGFYLLEGPSDKLGILYNEQTRKADFCVRVTGRSMEPKIMDGDIILIRTQPAVDIHEIGLFIINNHGYVKKQGPDRLISINPNYEDVYINEFDEIRCCGKYIGELDPEWVISRQSSDEIP